MTEIHTDYALHVGAFGPPRVQPVRRMEKHILFLFLSFQRLCQSPTAWILKPRYGMQQVVPSPTHGGVMLDREQVLALLATNPPEKHLIQHALASEAVMCALARHLGRGRGSLGPTGAAARFSLSPHPTPCQHGLCSEPNARRPPEKAVRAHNGEMTAWSLLHLRLRPALRKP